MRRGRHAPVEAEDPIHVLNESERAGIRAWRGAAFAGFGRGLGREARAERRLLREAYAAVGVQLDFAQIRRLLRAFVAGDVIERATLRAVALAPAI